MKYFYKSFSIFFFLNKKKRKVYDSLVVSEDFRCNRLCIFLSIKGCFFERRTEYIFIMLTYQMRMIV